MNNFTKTSRIMVVVRTFLRLVSSLDYRCSRGLGFLARTDHWLVVVSFLSLFLQQSPNYCAYSLANPGVGGEAALSQWNRLQSKQISHSLYTAMSLFVSVCLSPFPYQAPVKGQRFTLRPNIKTYFLC